MSSPSDEGDALPDVPAGARGAEVLLVDRDARVREGLRRLLADASVIVTATDDAAKALHLAREKFFAAAVVDFDTPELDGGPGLLAQLRECSPQTRVVLLSARQTFDVATQGFRAGAVDVVAKEPDNVKYLTGAVLACCAEELLVDDRQVFQADLVAVLEQFLERLMAASRRAKVAEDQLAGEQAPVEGGECTVLLVDDNPRNGPGLQHALGTDAGYRVVSAITGGEALDCASSQGFQLALVKRELPDLPSTMVIKSLRAQVPDGIVLRFSPPTDQPGRVELVEGSKMIEVLPQLATGEQMVTCIRELREAYQAKLRERHYLRAFREEHYDFLRRYVELKQKLAQLADRAEHRRKTTTDR